MERFTARERDVAQQVIRGKTNAAGAKALGIAMPTFKIHLGNVFAKLGINRREDLPAAMERNKEAL